MTETVSDSTVSTARRKLLIEEAPKLKSKIGWLFPEANHSANFDDLYEILHKFYSVETSHNFSKKDLKDFLKFLRYPIKNKVEGSERGPHYLTFFKVVLNNFIHSFETIRDAPHSFYQNVVGDKFKIFYSIANLIQEAIKEYDSPLLSPDYLRRDLIAHFKYKDKDSGEYTKISEDQIVKEINITGAGLVDTNPIYAALMFPFVSKNVRKVNLDTYFFILGSLINAVLTYPTEKRLANVFRDIRKVQEPLINHLSPINFNPMDYTELIALLYREKSIEGLSKVASIISDIVFPIPKKPRKEDSKGGTKTGKSPYYVIEFSSEDLIDITPTDAEELEGISFVSLRSKMTDNNLADEENELAEFDEAEDELIDHNEVYIKEKSTSILNLDQNNRNIKQAANALQNFNQFLIQPPAPSELKVIFKELELKSLLAKKDTKRILYDDLASRINFIVSFLTGRKLTETQDTYYLLKDKIDENVLSAAFMSLTKDFSTLLIPFKPKKALVDQDVYKLKTHIELPLPKIVRQHLEQLIAEIESVKDLSGNHIRITSRLNDVKRLISSSLDKRITPAYLTNYLRNSLKKLAIDQDWVVHALSGKSLGLSEVQAHYTASFGDPIFQTYQKHIKLFFNEEISYPPIAKVSRNSIYGNPNRVKFDIIRLFLDSVNQLLQSYSVFAEGKLSELATQDLMDCYNLVTIWFETYLSISTGARNVTNPYIYSESISQEGFAPLNDKDIHDGYTTRQVYIYKAVREQQIGYEIFAVKILKELTNRKVLGRDKLTGDNLKNTSNLRFKSLLANKDKDYFKYFPGLVILEPRKARWLKVSPYTRHKAKINLKNLNLKHLEDEQKGQFFKLLDRFIALPANTNRRFLRSMMLDIGNLNGNHLDKLMGHQNHGRESWNPYSTFNTPEFIKAIQEAYIRIWKNIKITPLFEVARGGR